MDFKIQHISIEQFAAIKEPENDNVLFYIDVKTGCNKDLRSVLITIEVRFSESDNQPFLIMKTNNFFQIKEESWRGMIDDSTGVITIPNKLVVTLIQMSISQTRGMMFVKTENTPFSKYLIPIVTVNNLKADKDLIVYPDKK